MELRVLRYFVATADVGTASGAAAELHLTQPALSRQLRQLERELGADLFARVRGRLVLSAAGREFLPIARDLLVRAEHAKQAAAELAAGRLGHIALAAPTTTLTDVLAPFLATLRDDDPVPTVIESGPDDAYAALDRGVDLVIVTERPHRELARTAIAVLPVFAYVRADHPWSGRPGVTLDELAAMPVVVLPPHLKTRQILDGALHQAGLALESAVETSNAQVAQALAAAGRGAAVVTDDPRFGLHPLEILHSGAALRIHLWAAWRPSHHASPTLGSFAARLRGFCAERYGPQVLPPDAR